MSPHYIGKRTDSRLQNGNGIVALFGRRIRNLFRIVVFFFFLRHSDLIPLDIKGSVFFWGIWKPTVLAPSNCATKKQTNSVVTIKGACVSWHCVEESSETVALQQ